LDSAIEAIYPIIEDVRHLSLPGIDQLTEIFTWKKSTVTWRFGADFLWAGPRAPEVWGECPIPSGLILILLATEITMFCDSRLESQF